MVYAVGHGGMAMASGGAARSFTGAMKYYYGQGDFYRQKSEPVAKPKRGDAGHMVSAQQYYGGALVLYALSQKVGAPAFAKIERTWLSRYAGRSASTANYIALASEISHKSLGPFLRSWLYGTK